MRLSEREQVIVENPKQKYPPAVCLGIKEGVFTGIWHRKVFNYYKSLIPPHIKAEQQIWLSTTEEIVGFIENLKDPAFEIQLIEYICIFDTISDIYDIVSFFKQLKDKLPEYARIIYSNYNWKWFLLFKISAYFKLSRNRPFSNFYKDADLDCFSDMSGWENVRKISRFFVPFTIPWIGDFIEAFLARLPILRHFTLNTIFVCRKRGNTGNVGRSATVLIPCRNEQGNIEAIIKRMPMLGKSTQLVFINDKSTDNTEAEILRLRKELPQKDIILLRGKGIGKGEAVREGMKEATGDICMILDADLTVLPEDLPQFYDAINSRVADFIHGTRFVYPRKKNAMNFANILGNIFFSFLFSFILEQRTTDTLCGTKVFWRRDWQIFEDMKRKLKNSDIWGDYNLIFGAARYGLKMGQLPVRYFERLEGVSKMDKRIRNGIMMIKTSWHAIWSVKYVK